MLACIFEILNRRIFLYTMTTAGIYNVLAARIIAFYGASPGASPADCSISTQKVGHYKLFWKYHNFQRNKPVVVGLGLERR